MDKFLEGIIVVLVVLMSIFFFAFISVSICDKQTERKYGIGKAIEECEKNLPRNEYCDWEIITHKREKKNV